MKIKIDNKIISYDSPVFVIAEAGINHNGRLDLALKLIDAAADAGADAVKFQTFRAEQVSVVLAKMADYQRLNTGKTESLLEMARKLEMPEYHWPALIQHARERGIIFFSTPHGHIESADLLQKLKMPAFKISSGDLTNIPLLEHVARFKKPVILSTGMGNLKEIKEAIAAIKKNGNHKIIVLHCTTNYPLPLQEVNLKAMKTLMEKLDVLVGYSDHTEGGLVPVVAAALGACVIEKHLTLDKNMEGPDHKASADPSELKNIVAAVKNMPVIMGIPAKVPTVGEKKTIPLVRRSIVAAIDIPKDTKIEIEMLTMKRPGTGIEPKFMYRVVGKKTKHKLRKNSIIKFSDLK